MSIPRNLGNFADNVNTNGKVEVTGINATGTPSASTALLGNGTWGTVTTSPAGSTGQVQYNNAGAFGALPDGTSGQVLTSAGSGSAPAWASPAAGGFSNMAVFTSSGTWTIPAGVTKCKVYVTAAGGAGGTADGGGTKSGSGAGAGGTSIKIVTLSGSTATITIGAGAPSQGGSSSNGGDGGNSSFVNGSTIVSANGGIGGQNWANYESGRGGAPSTTGDLNLGGGDGTQNQSANLGAAGSMTGGSSFWGGGGGDRYAPDAQVYGAGGAGGQGGNPSGAGKSGVVVIEY